MYIHQLHLVALVWCAFFAGFNVNTLIGNYDSKTKAVSGISLAMMAVTFVYFLLT